MLIDAHNHPGLPGFTAEKIVRNMDENGIDKNGSLRGMPPSRITT